MPMFASVWRGIVEQRHEISRKVALIKSRNSSDMQDSTCLARAGIRPGVIEQSPWLMPAGKSLGVFQPSVATTRISGGQVAVCISFEESRTFHRFGDAR
jgi:hypothetical protein